MLRCEDLLSDADFRHLSTIPDIAVDLRYAGANNFAGYDLYGALDCAWVHRIAAEGLERAAALLAEEAPEYRLVVLDALRPHRIQVRIWDELQDNALRRYFADPAVGSIHSFGMAVDVTLLDAAGREVDMGSGFDEMSELSHPEFEARHLASGQLTTAQQRHRELLRGVLTRSGFQGVSHEWWHFDMLDRDHVRQHFERVE